MTVHPRQLAMQLLQSGRLVEALPLLADANRTAPGDLPVLHALAQLLQSVGRRCEAVERYRLAATILPQEPSVLAGWARALLLTGDRAAAVDQLHNLLNLEPESDAAHGYLQSLLREFDRPELACALLLPLVERRRTDTVLLRQYVRSLLDAERLDDAHVVLERYHTLFPSDPYAPVELGRLVLNRGDRVTARKHFRSALDANPDYAAALWHLADLDGGALDSATARHVERLVTSERDPKASAGLHDILARHHDRTGNFEAAARHIGQTNALMQSLASPGQRYDPAAHAAEVDSTIRDFTADLLKRLHGVGHTGRRPIFVVGLPRSGTTLLEQMLASHPEIDGIGEQGLAAASLRNALAASRGSVADLSPAAVHAATAWHLQGIDNALLRLTNARHALRAVDKMPDNYLLLGWLRIAFPRAAIIHCVRDPRDVAFSCWLTQFAAVPWSFTLDHIAHRVEQHRRLLRHWRSVFGSTITEIRYEALASDPEPHLRRALCAIGLDWHPGMLEFHKGGRFVGSASMRQVREPLNTRNVDRWRNYARALRPVLHRLDDVARQDDRELAKLDID